MKIQEWWAWLQGKKTYLATAALFVVGGLNAIGVEVPNCVLVLLAALGLYSMRSAIKKVEE